MNLQFLRHIDWKRIVNLICDVIIWGFICGVALIILLVALNVFAFTSFKIPTTSMTPALQPGDMILVEKLTMGPRLFSLDDARDRKPFEIKRLHGFGELERNDIAVFNQPYCTRYDSIGFDLFLYYCKRCLAVPGDSIEIRDCRYRVRGIDDAIGDTVQQRELCRALKNEFFLNGMKEHHCYRTFPDDSVLTWTIRDFGPLYVPAAGDTIRLTRDNYALYKILIEWETKQKAVYRQDTCIIGGTPCQNYVFKHGYYFMGGDNCFDSQDSRYFGLIPDEHVVGRAIMIWNHVNPHTKKRETKRIFTRL